MMAKSDQLNYIVSCRNVTIVDYGDEYNNKKVGLFLSICATS